MGETTNEVSSLENNSSQEASEIRSGIEQTRSNLSATLDALQDKLDPSRVAEQIKEQIHEKAVEAFDSAKAAVKEATVGKAGKIMSSMSDSVSDMTERAGTAVSETSSSVVQYIRDNPVSFALVGIGLGLLAMNKGGKQQPSYRGDANGGPSLADRARDAAGGLADSARGAAASVSDNAKAAASTVQDATSSVADSTRQRYHDVSDRARQGVQVANNRVKETWQDNPMALGIAVFGAGALVGMTLPSTQVEGEYMGEARERLVGQAKSVAQDVVEKVQHVSAEVGETVKSAAQKEGLVGE